jgi:hypothetical protein
MRSIGSPRTSQQLWLIMTTSRSQELRDTIRHLRRHGIKAWRPTGVSRNRLIELLLLACDRLDADDPHSAMRSLQARSAALGSRPLPTKK